jgi:tetratricopeptide (TPR) repeat protein
MLCLTSLYWIEMSRRRTHRTAVFIVGALFLAVTGLPAGAQISAGGASPQAVLEEHYDAAQNFQTAGDLPQAAFQYKLFISSALVQLAFHRSKAGDFPKASQYFDGSLALVPNDSSVALEYAEAALAAKDFPKAQSLAQTVIDAEPKNAKARRVLGRTLLERNDLEAARGQLETAVALESDFENGYALATAYLALKEEKSAAKIFTEMLAAFGDSAALRMNFGRAYGEYGYPELAISEFKKAIAKDPQAPGAHYLLGASYVLSMGEIDFPLAIAEFNKELEINPNDYFSHSQLGYIYLSQHKLPEAVAELTRAVQLDPRDPDAFLSLGQAYSELDNPTDAEAALRKSIELTTDPARNHYQVQRAHYLLGRILLQSNRADDGKKEMAASEQLSKLSVQENQGKLRAGSIGETEASASFKDSAAARPLDAEAMKQIVAYENQIGPAIADSYNNLGVIAAGDNDLTSALEYFEQAYVWNPALDTLDYNWGRAAFTAKRFDEAVGPLERYMNAHPEDTGARATLGLNYFLGKNCKEALDTFEPIGAQINSTPTLAFAYAVCQTKAGNFDRGLASLKELELAHPNIVDNHRALAEAYASRENFADAASEMGEVLRLSPSDADAAKLEQEYESRARAVQKPK